MSTLKSINVQHPSATTINIVNDSSGNVTAGANLTVTGTSTLTGNVAASGTLTIGGVAAVAVAPGTNGNVLTSNGTIWTSAAPAATASLTLLATLTTTSGTTQSATGLATTYKNLVCVYEGVGNSTGSDGLIIAASSTNGAAYGTTIGAANSSPAYGVQFIWRANSSLANHPASNSLRTGLADALCVLPTTTAAPINALRFSWTTGYTFNAGTIYIYGWN